MKNLEAKGYEIHRFDSWFEVEYKTVVLVALDGKPTDYTEEYIIKKADKAAKRIFGEVPEAKQEEEKPEEIKFEVGAVYQLRCKDGKIAKRTATFKGMWNDVEGLFKIGATTRPVKIKSDGKMQYTVKAFSYAQHSVDIFSKYENILATDRIS